MKKILFIALVVLVGCREKKAKAFSFYQIGFVTKGMEINGIQVYGLDSIKVHYQQWAADSAIIFLDDTTLYPSPNPFK